MGPPCGSRPPRCRGSEGGRRIFAYALPDLTLAARTPQAKRPDLLWFTPDGTEAWVTNRHAASVSVIDVKTLENVAVIPMGQNPDGIVIVP